MVPRLVIAVVLGALLFCGVLPAHASADTIAGKVTTTGGSAIAGVTVDVLTASGATLASGTSAANGTYAVTVSAGTYDVRFTPPAASGYGTLLVRGRATGVPLDVQLVTSSSVVFSGVVRDPTGAPVTGVQVRLYDAAFSVIVASGTPAADGAFSLSVAPGSYVLWVGKNSPQSSGQTPNGLWAVQTPMTLATSLTQDLTIPSITVDVTAVGPSGDPVPGTALSATGYSKNLSLFPGDGRASASSNDSTATTDANGKGRLVIFPENSGSTTGNSATPPSGAGLAAVTFDLAGLTTSGTRTVTLPGAQTMSGVVRDPTGAPVTGEQVRLYDANFSVIVASSTPGADGAYSLSAAPGNYILWIAKNSAHTSGQTPTGSSWVVQTPISITGDRTQDLTIPTITVATTVLTAGGAPVPGTTLSATGYSKNLSLFPGDSQATASFNDSTATTNGNGQGLLVIFPENNGSTTGNSASPPSGSGLGAITFDLAGLTTNGTRTLTLPGDESLSGVVRDPTGAPVTGEEVRLYNANFSVIVASSTPGADGAYSLSAAPGNYILWIAKNSAHTSGQTPTGSWAVQTPITITGDRAQDLTIPTITVETTTVGPAGDPVPGTTLSATGYSKNLSLFPGDGQASASFNDSTATTDGNGKGLLVIFPENNGATTGNLATPPPTTTLPAATLNLRDITTNTSLVIAFQPSSVDVFAPLITCDPPDGAWHTDDVAIHCTASDGGSGLANAADASFSLTAGLDDGRESANAVTGTRRVCDLAQNCATAGPVTGIKIDRQAPSLTVSSPSEGAVLVRGDPATAHYACSDGGSSVTSCVGSLGDGAAIDTSQLGPHEFTVTATDALGHTRATTTHYTVAAEPPPAATPTPTPPPGGGSNFAADPTPTATATPSATATPVPSGSLPPPVQGESTTIARVTGSVYITLAGSSTPVKLTASSTIPDGSEVDATKGTVTVTVATETGTTERAQARGGTFVIELGATTYLRLTQPLACGGKSRASAAGSKPPKKKRKQVKQRSLWVHDTGGDWGTKGKHADTTVVGTTWTTTDTCTSTTVKVSSGTVKVKPHTGGKATTVRAPHSRTVTKKG